MEDDLNAQIMRDISSFLPPNTQSKSKGNGIRLENLDDPPPQSGKQQSSEDSVVGLQTSMAATRLLSNSGQTKIAKRMMTVNEEVQIARQLTKEKKQKDQKARKEAERTASIPKPKRVEQQDLHQEAEEVPLPNTMPVNMHIQNMEQHNRRAHQVQLFASHVERPTQPSTAQIIATPDVTSTLAFARKVEELRLCTDQYMQMLSDYPNLKRQNIPVFTRKTLQPFLFKANPMNSYERDCCNLDRPPVHGEARIQCAGHKLSGDLLGPAKAFRPRELLFPDQIVRINHALDVEHSDPRVHLLPVPQMCYLCHIYLTYQMYLDQRNKLHEREVKDHTSNCQDTRTTMVTILNRFIVTFGTEGEYDIRRLIASDSISLGILGPFPMWSPRHYRPVVDTSGLPGFAENDVMVFRLSQEPSQLIESNNPNDSTRSTPTIAKRGATLSRQ